MAKKVLAANDAAAAEQEAEAQAEDLTPLSEEELRRMTPQARIARLRALEEARRKELEETRRKVEQEIAATQELIEETEEEAQEGREEPARRQEESLEERIVRERVEVPAPRQYETGAEYRPLQAALEAAADNLNRLYNTNEWTEREVQIYQQSRETVDRARGYTLTSERMLEELGTVEGMLRRLQYR